MVNSHVPSFESFTFPAGEVSVCLRGSTPLDSEARITVRIRNGDDFMRLALQVDALRRSGAKRISAFLPYMPYARQDRVDVPGNSLSIRVFADLLNSLKIDEVVTFDPHSDVVAAVVDRCRVISPRGYVAKVIKDRIIYDHGPDGFLLVSPDAGQEKKIHNLRLGYPVLQGLKHRDVATGKLSGFGIVDQDAPIGKACVIVDDMIDGGGTFVGLAEVLRARHATHVYLICSHGIFSKGARVADKFDRVFVTDSYMNPPSHENITGYSVNHDGLFFPIMP
jgi:ribose-phosphate pyrophosphokinase